MAEQLGSRPKAILLQECFLTRDELFAIKLQDYKTVAVTAPDKIRVKMPKNPGKTILRQRRASAILVDRELHVQPLKERTKKLIELIGVRVVGDARKTYEDPFDLWSVYCGPNRKEGEQLSRLLKEIVATSDRRVLLAGDFNVDINFTRSNYLYRKTVRALDEMDAEGQLCILNEYSEGTTRSGTTIDLAVTIGDWDEGFATPVQYDLGSTHYPICIGVCTKEVPADKQEHIEVPSFTRNEKVACKIQQRCTMILEDIENYNANDMSQAILNIFKEEAAAPKPRGKRKKKRNWWNEEPKALWLKKNDHLTKKGRDDTFQAINKDLQAAISEAKNKSFRAFASGLDHRSNNGNVFRAMRTVGVKQPSKIAELTVCAKDGTLVTNLREKAQVLSRRYQLPLGQHPKRNPARKKLLKDRRDANENMHSKGQGHIPYTTAEARIAREEMSNNKSPGLSRVRKEDLDMGGAEMDTVAGKLADKIALEGLWPKVFKRGIICPIPKDSEAYDLINEDQTRPITLLETLDKWIQRMVYNRISPHVEFAESQAGYCRSLSCDHHTTLVSDFVMNRQDKPYCIAVFTDISKAFDSVPLEELVDVIWASKMPTACKWVLSSFVEGRQFRVEIRDAKGNVSASEWRKLLYGTPEGSILGPILWNLFFDPLLREIAELSETSAARTAPRLAVENSTSATKSVVQPRQEQTGEVVTVIGCNVMDRGLPASKSCEDTASHLPQKTEHATSHLPRTEQAEATEHNGSKAEETEEAADTIVTTGAAEINSQAVAEDLDTAFADDLTLIAASSDPKLAERLIEEKLLIFEGFLEERGMVAARHKLKTMCLDPYQREYEPIVRYKGKNIEVVEEHKLLGVIYDKNMSFIKHWEMVVNSVIKRTRTISALRSTTWGPTQETALVLHRCYVESKVRYGMLAWYTFLDFDVQMQKPEKYQKHKTKLGTYLRKSIRIAIGLPIQCWNEALMAESDLDSLEDLELKCAVSLYGRINPTDTSHMTLARRHYLRQEPCWARNLAKVPASIWKGPIQKKLQRKKIFTSNKVKVEEGTLNTQEQANRIEEKHQRLLYTDASVAKLGTRMGKAAIGYMWYAKATDGTWQVEAQRRVDISTGHSSYSAEAIAIWLALENDPALAQSQEAGRSRGTNNRLPTFNGEDPVNAGPLAPVLAPVLSYPIDDEEIGVGKIGVFTDSLSNLMTIRKGIAETAEQEQLLQTVMNHPYAMTFYHVKAHNDNAKNNEVDRLCDVTARPPSREEASNLKGSITASKMREWMKTWLSNRRLQKIRDSGAAKRNKRATRLWMKKSITGGTGQLLQKPKRHNQLPRREGILMAKARVNRWTLCCWFLDFIKARKGALCLQCGLPDTTEHVIETCELHEGPRSTLRQKLNHHGKIAELLADNDRTTVEALASFLIKADDLRKKLLSKAEELKRAEEPAKEAKENSDEAKMQAPERKAQEQEK